MKFKIFLSFFLLTNHLFAQNKRPEEFGFKHIQMQYQGDIKWQSIWKIISIIEMARVMETDTATYAEDAIKNWEKIVAGSNNTIAKQGDSYKATYGFSIPPPINYLSKLKIPILVTYGTKDYRLVSYVDYLRVETFRQRKKNFTFKAYIGTEHKFFPLKPNGEINYDIFNWDKVANDWREWLKMK
jgi:pimeloyl-ACP methyl ester carboxylesterase